MPLLSKPELVRIAVTAAQTCGLDPALVCAHIDVRTRWHSGFCVATPISYLNHSAFPDPMEAEYRATQWGLMAISGEFARGECYTLPLPSLLGPAENLRLGCQLFLRLQQPRSDYVDAIVQSLLAWNRENSRDIAAQTLARLESWRALLLRIDEIPRAFPDACTPLPPECSRIPDNPLLEPR